MLLLQLFVCIVVAAALASLIAVVIVISRCCQPAFMRSALFCLAITGVCCRCCFCCWCYYYYLMLFLNFSLWQGWKSKIKMLHVIYAFNLSGWHIKYGKRCTNTHTYMHTYTYIYIHMYSCIINAAGDLQCNADANSQENVKL